MSQLKGPGDRIETRCSRCDDLTGHIIVAMVGGDIVKVECCACGSVHKYYPPRIEKKSAGESSTVSRKKGTQSTAARRTNLAKAEAHESAWRTEIERPSAPEARPYAMDIILQKGDIINHTHFGLGAVVATMGQNKAEVLFRDGVRILRCVCA